MYSIVIFQTEKGTPVEGVPTSWLKTVNHETYCYWPKKDPSQLIRRYVTADPSWKLFKCKVLSKAATYEQMTKQRKESMELTLEQDTENSAVEESSGTEEDIPIQPSSSQKRKTNQNEANISSEPDEELSPPVKMSKCNKKRREFENHISSKSESNKMLENMAEILGKVNTLVTNSTAQMKAERALYKEVVNVREEMKSLKKNIKRIGSTPAIEPSNLPPMPL